MAADITVGNQTDLIAAIAGAPSGTPYTIALSADFPITVQIGVPAGKDIVLDGDGHTLTRAAGFTNSLLNVVAGAALTLANIVLDGNRPNLVFAQNALVSNAGSLTITAGTVLQNNWNTGTSLYTAGGGISSTGSVTMTGGLITGNNSYNVQGGGIYMIGGVLTMTGGEISGNTALSYGGGVYLRTSTFYMVDGLIAGNECSGFGGGVAVYWNSAFVMDGGSIQANTGSTNGGGVYVGGVALAPSSFTLNGGAIAGNSSREGGGVFVNGSTLDTISTFLMTGGEITGNHALNQGLTAYGGGVFNSGTFLQTGGSIAMNDSEQMAGGVLNIGTYTLLAGVVAGNVAANNGGGIFNYGSTLTVTGAVVTANVAGNFGGGIFLYFGEENTLITDSQVTANSASKGGGIYADRGAFTVSGAAMLIAGNSATSAEECDTGGGIYATTRTNAHVDAGVIFTRNYVTHAYNAPLGPDLAAYESVVHSPSLDPQYVYAWNNADINYCTTLMLPVQITYWRNAEPGDPVHMILSTDLSEGDAIAQIPPPWADGTLNFAGWSLTPDDTCPTLHMPMPRAYHAADFSGGIPAELNVYAIWCPEPVYHTVTFDARGGTAVPAQKLLDGETAVFGLSTRADCILEGWYTNENLEVRFNFATPIYEDLTLYAKWICMDELDLTEDATLAEKLAELAKLAALQSLLAALVEGDKCYTIGILTEYTYHVVEADGQLYVRSKPLEQQYLGIVPLTVAMVQAEIAQLKL
jgi:hypothetical protein